MEHLRPEADLHCHILPDWDDGPRSYREALELAKSASASGLKKILVTPHVGRRLRGIVEKPSHDIAMVARELEAKLRADGIDIELIAAAELTMDSAELPNLLKSNAHWTVGGQGHYALIESSSNIWPAYAGRFLQGVFFAGATPIIAHPERYAQVQRFPAILNDLYEKGVLLQITARSFLGNDDRRTKKCAMALLKAGMVSVIASDAHNSRAVWPEAVVKTVTDIVGQTEAHRIFIENPQKILSGEPIYNPDIKALRRSSFLSRLWGK